MSKKGEVKKKSRGDWREVLQTLYQARSRHDKIQVLYDAARCAHLQNLTLEHVFIAARKFGFQRIPCNKINAIYTQKRMPYRK